MKKVALRNRKEVSKMVNGILQVRGPFYESHREEIKYLLKMSIRLFQQSHPLDQALSNHENGEGLTLGVTHPKLAEYLGRTLYKRFGGKAVYDMLHDTGQARVYWER